MSLGNVGFHRHQRTAFIRNRDLTLGVKELAKEDKMHHAMQEGVCPRCREKVQWRFQFNKYKPLTRPGNCQNCKQKTVTKAYRTFCDPCANKKKCCPACTLERDAWKATEEGDGEDEDEEDEQEAPSSSIRGKKNRDKDKGSMKAFVKKTFTSTKVAKDDGDDEEDEEEEEEEEDDEEEEDGEEGVKMDAAAEPEEGDGQGDEEGEGESEELKKKEEADALSFQKAAAELEWVDQDKFLHVATSKYNKQRQTGKETDVFAFQKDA